jgi:isoquinoline 1-oxidoreductase beta subunit
MPTLNINGQTHNVEVESDTPLLWVLRDTLGMTGTKYGCGIAQCGACTVHVDGKPVRSCQLTVDNVGNRAVTTIEAIGNTPNGAKIQAAWIDIEVPQCGYCQAGQIMSATALLNRTPNPDDADIDAAMAGNICRCGTSSRCVRPFTPQPALDQEAQMNFVPKMNRRSFVVGAASVGGGLALGLNIPFGSQVVRAADGSPEVNAWVVIRPDDTVVIRIARSEMGQGSLTGLAQLVAEELECDWSKVTTEFPTPGQSLARKRVYGDMSTGGSRGIRTSHQYVREAGAAARTMLIQAAANEWKVPASECSVANSVIAHKASGRTTTYGTVAEAAAKLEPPKDIKLKDPKDWKIAGKGLKRLDTADKLVGKLVYGIEISMPGLLVATIKDSPVQTGKIKSFDAAKVTGMPGVKNVVQVGSSGVAVIADTYWHAHKAIEALPIVWDPGEAGKVSSASIAEFLKGGLDAEQAFVGNKAGDAKSAIGGAARKIEAVYNYPYQNHATMEPMNMTALYTADKCEVWGPTQNGEAALAATSEESGLPIGKCDVHKTICGGGFGRRGRVDYVRQAVAIAKQMPGTPIKLIWSREEDMTHDAFHPVTQAKLTAGIDADGNVVGFHFRISGQSISASLAPERLEQGGMDPTVFQGLSPNSPEGNFGYNFTS